MGDPEEDIDEEMEEEEMDFVSRSEEKYEDKNAELSKRNNKVVNIHATAQLQVVLVKPERFEDASTVADPSQCQAHRGAQSGIGQQGRGPAYSGFSQRRGLCQRRPDQKGG